MSVIPVALAIAAVALTLFVLRERHRARNGRSALGTAVSGTVLSVGLASTLQSALSGVGIGGQAAHGMIDAVRQSAGGALAALRDSGAPSPFGPGSRTAVDALPSGFAEATRLAVLAAGAFLVLGFLGALRVRVAAGREARPRHIP